MRNIYLDYNYYLNNKKRFNIFFNIILRYKIDKNNKLFIKENINYLDDRLDYYQKKSILIDDNTLLVAGAGSGKTTTIINKINYLIENKNIDPKDILCISFTNNTVDDLKERIKYPVDIYTFHKLSLSLLDDHNYFYGISGDYLEYIIDEIFYNYELDYFKKVILSFINLYKQKNIDYKLMNRISKRNILLKLIYKIYLIYQDELYSQGLIDFNDMINKATNVTKELGLKRFYKYIIIDEYQDISYERYLLIKTIKDICNSKVFAVGDDFQSIYAFSGSDIKMFLQFKRYFGYSKIIKLNRTYRYSQELSNVSTKFILKNITQIRKKIISTKRLSKPIKIIYYNNNEDIILKRFLDTANTNITILIRNSKDIYKLKSVDIKIKSSKIIYKDKKIDYMTIHKSKGLEFDNVLILNLEDDVVGFPNKMKNPKIFKYIDAKDNSIFEERRLFYVALTRTKNNVYLFVNKNKPSIFVRELLLDSKKYIEFISL
ncbi:MAG: UvrD-helicase domain-containing protein [Bacilli bacterium]|nr:UvrD-helicase domain-containing protein [Bacilli bacterium]